jgi:hypothetical protein
MLQLAWGHYVPHAHLPPERLTPPPEQNLSMILPTNFDHTIDYDDDYDFD